MKISTFMISIVLVALIVATFSNFFSGVASEYGVVMDDNTTSTLAAYNEFAEIQNRTADINRTLFSSSSGESGVTDLVGQFLGSGFNVLRIAKASFKAFYNLAQNFIGAVGLPGFFLDTLIVIALIIVLFIIISVLVGKDV